jgi:hypothetical protein
MGRFWEYPPEHHFKSGIVTNDDIALLSEPDRRLLSVGAHPGAFEQALVTRGIPPQNILLADINPELATVTTLQTIIFNMHDAWPDIGTFDRIMFPESLCIAITDKIGKDAEDPVEAECLAHILREALMRLRPAGIIRANGPMCHPNVVKLTQKILQNEGLSVMIDYHRFLMSVHL